MSKKNLNEEVNVNELEEAKDECEAVVLEDVADVISAEAIVEEEENTAVATEELEVMVEPEAEAESEAEEIAEVSVEAMIEEGTTEVADESEVEEIAEAPAEAVVEEDVIEVAEASDEEEHKAQSKEAEVKDVKEEKKPKNILRTTIFVLGFIMIAEALYSGISTLMQAAAYAEMYGTTAATMAIAYIPYAIQAMLPFVAYSALSFGIVKIMKKLDC